MRHQRSMRLPAIVMLLAIAGLITTAAAQEFGETIVKRGTIPDDFYVAARTVEIAARVQGDLAAAGQRVTITEAVDEDVITAAETVSVNAPIADDLRTVGRLVTIAEGVGGHVVAAGETVTLSTDGSTGSWAWMAGREVQVLGNVGGELKAAAQQVVIGGTVDGDVTVYAEKVRVLDSAHIRGAFHYHGGEDPAIADGAIIEGDMTRSTRPDTGEEGAHTDDGVNVGAGIVFGLSMLVVGAVYLLGFPVFSGEAAGNGTRRMLTSLGLGIAALIVTPFVAVLAMITLVGLPLGLAILALYPVMLLVGYVNGVAAVGHMGVRRWRRTDTPGRRAVITAFVMALLAIVLLQIIPYVGALLGLAIWLLGIGSLVLALAGRYRGKNEPAAA
ncbi:hypothetical protein [Arhodomonas sp. AD133]|uniref:hypothetical protein n=1 Tax=Arhodomonas sp. AD133 TaxID=3415009 RepID=UPI003EBC3E2C